MKKIKIFKNDRERHNFNMLFSVIYILLFVIGLLAGFSFFFMGYHNMDIGFNILLLEQNYDIDLVDHASDGSYYEGKEAYTLGNHQMRLGLFLSTFSGIFFGFYLAVLYIASIKSKKKK